MLCTFSFVYLIFLNFFSQKGLMSQKKLRQSPSKAPHCPGLIPRLKNNLLLFFFASAEVWTPQGRKAALFTPFSYPRASCTQKGNKRYLWRGWMYGRMHEIYQLKVAALAISCCSVAPFESYR